MAKPGEKAPDSNCHDRTDHTQHQSRQTLHIRYNFQQDRELNRGPALLTNTPPAPQKQLASDIFSTNTCRMQG